MSAVLLIRLKITDLTAWSALETGRRLLEPGSELARLTREQLLLFEPQTGAGAESFEEPLREAVRHSNFFVNPNKESYSFFGASERGAAWTPPEGAWGILARAREDTSDRGLLERLIREHPLEGLAAIRRAKTWWLWTRGPGGRGIESAALSLGVLHDQSHGLLVNPHSEAATILDGPTPWDRVERFLIDPPPAYRAAA